MCNNMTNIYFIRHAEPNYENYDDTLRELTVKGLKDRRLVTAFLADKNIDVVISSPYKRAYDTVYDFAAKQGLNIEIIEDFRERKIDSEWITDFNTFCKNQWNDFDYKLTDGESLGEVQHRNIRALNQILEKYSGKNVVIGSHGTALCTIIHYYDNTFGYTEFERIRGLMPWVVQLTFEKNTCIKIQKYNLFENLYNL